jgi:hypothetical protein
MPAWWEWYSNVNPVAWSVYGLVASQLGDDYTYYVNTCAPRRAEGRVRYPILCCLGAGPACSGGLPAPLRAPTCVRSDGALPTAGAGAVRACSTRRMQRAPSRAD